jgi:hypothetical protein
MLAIMAVECWSHGVNFGVPDLVDSDLILFYGTTILSKIGPKFAFRFHPFIFQHG